MSCIYKYKGKNYSKDEFYSLVKNTMVQPRTVQKYNKVLFPVGDTAAKIEGHDTVEQFIVRKERRVKEIEDRIVALGKYTIKQETNQITADDEYIYYDENGNRESGYMETKKQAENELTRTKEGLEREKIQINKEIEDAKAGKLKISSIANFYETTIFNILKKQGYNPVRITDEYGNGWYEVEIKEKDKTEIINFNKNTNQSNPKNISNNISHKEISNSLNKVIESLGIDIKTVEYLKTREGKIDKTLTAEARIVKTAEKIQKVISFVRGKESFDILSEEVAHIFTGLLGFSHPLYQSLEKQIVKYPEYEEVKKDYPELTSEKDIRFEAIGKLIGKNIVELAQNKAQNSILQNIWDAIIRWFRKMGLKEPNEFQKVAIDLLNNNINQYTLQEIEIQANAKKPRDFDRLDWQDDNKSSRDYWNKKRKYSKKIPMKNALSLNSENDNNIITNKPGNQKVNWYQMKKVKPIFTSDISLNPSTVKEIEQILRDTMPTFSYLEAADMQWLAEKCADGTFKLTCQI